MTRYARCAALLQGVNVGGRRKVPSAELRELAAGLGLDDPRTHLASGNLVFGGAGRSPETLARELSEALRARFGFEVPTLVRTAAELKEAVERCPYDVDSVDPAGLLVYFLDVPADKDPRLMALREADFGEDRWEVRGKHVYVLFPGGSGRSKLGPALLRALPGYVVTSRNWRTVTRLLAMAGD